MSFLPKLKPGQNGYFNPIGDSIATVKVQLDDAAAFSGTDFFEDAAAEHPRVSKFDDGGAGYKEVAAGSRLSLPSYKRTVEVHGFFSKNITAPTISKVDQGGVVTAISTFPTTLLPGEDLQFGGTASDPDNYVAVQVRDANRASL